MQYTPRIIHKGGVLWCINTGSVLVHITHFIQGYITGIVAMKQLLLMLVNHRTESQRIEKIRKQYKAKHSHLCIICGLI